MNTKKINLIKIEEDTVCPDPDYIDNFPSGYGVYHYVNFELHLDNKKMCNGYFIKVDKGIANNVMTYSIDYVLEEPIDTNNSEEKIAFKEIHHVYDITEEVFKKVDALILDIDMDNIPKSMDKIFKKDNI